MVIYMLAIYFINLLELEIILHTLLIIVMQNAFSKHIGLYLTNRFCLITLKDYSLRLQTTFTNFTKIFQTIFFSRTVAEGLCPDFSPNFSAAIKTLYFARRTLYRPTRKSIVNKPIF